MAGAEKRKKHHDKDKYYKLAKEQGYRSRAAFKLTQINRKFHFLENAKVVIDLCAAPGGWTQVASRTMSTKGGGTILLAVDILPIRNIPNVITLIGDITTDKTKAHIKSQLQTASADVVLNDGAPNVGASYDRDAYAQNEIALHSLKCATQHLKRNGTFVTKLYRSSDYISFVWVAKQLFDKVQAVKPSASRSQSAEIFLVCTGYLDPTSIDPRLLDPKTVFEQVDGAATGGGDIAQKESGGVTIFHKKFGDKKKSRQGYDMSTLDATMRNIGSISQFIESSGSGAEVKDGEKKDPIQMLSFCTGLSFTCNLCNKKEDLRRQNDEKAAEDVPDCNCKFYLEHRLTTSEIKACVSDLKVLNKNDFKGLLTWRAKMQDALKESQEDSDTSDEDGGVDTGASSNEEEEDSDAEEERIQAEIEQLRHKKMREQKKIKKKERDAMAKSRRRAALGMDLNAIELPENDKIFTLATITSRGDLEAAREVDLNKVTDKQLMDTDDKSDEEDVARGEDGQVVAQGEDDDIDEETGYSYRLDRELDDAYDKYLANTKNKSAKAGTKMAKRSKKFMRTKTEEQAKEDEEMMDNDTKVYAKMLQGPKDSDDDSSDEEEHSCSDDDGFHADPVTPQEHERLQKERIEEKNPLIHALPSDPTSVKTARWFSNPIFESIGTTASLATIPGRKDSSSSKLQDVDDYDSDDVEHVEHMSSEDEGPSKKDKQSRSNFKNKAVAKEVELEKTLTADDVINMMPKTDKQIRHEKRLKANERKERKLNRRAKEAGELEGGFEVVTGDHDNDTEADNLDNLSEEGKKKILEARSLIKAGLGRGPKVQESNGFEIVSASDNKIGKGLLPIMDSRKYNSDNEDYDSDDYAETLALGTMMLRKSKEKAFVDASYNRFAWNDPEDLPHWFIDDESKHYRPQLPIPPALVAKMKERFMSLSTRPIAKVAEARARKNKRSKLKLNAAKKKADAVANSSEMSEAMKLKAISKAMRGHDSSRPAKTYVVSRKGGGNQGGKGIKLVDKRMMSDKRGMKRADLKRKGGGKKGGMTGSKRRRHHS